MTSVRYMTTSHGISKRFRLDNEPSETTLQELDDILLPVVRKGLHDIGSIRNNILSRSAEKLAIRRTSNLENNQSLIDFQIPNAICLKAFHHQSRREPLSILSQSNQHKYLKKETKSSIDAVNFNVSNVFNESCDNLEVSKSDEVSAKENPKPVGSEENWIDELPAKDKLKSVQSEECDKTVIIFEDINSETEFHNDVGISLEESHNNFNLKVIGDTLKTKQLDQVNVLKECQYNEVNNVIHPESKSEDAKISEVSMLVKNKTKSDVYYSNAYRMFSNVIQKAQNKVKPREICNQPSITITKDSLLQNKDTLSVNDNALPEIKTAPIKNSYADNLKSVLYDMEELEEFLDYCSQELFDMLSYFSASSEFLRFLSVEDESTETALQIVQLKYLSKQDGRFRTGSYNVIQEFGQTLLDNIIECGKIFGPAIDKYKSNLDIVSNTLFNFCSSSIESTLVADPELVYAVLKEVKEEMDQAKASERQVRSLFDTQSALIVKIRETVIKFKILINNLSF